LEFIQLLLGFETIENGKQNKYKTEPPTLATTDLGNWFCIWEIWQIRK
jgi:hypothetical protein